MRDAAAHLDFENAAILRDEIKRLQQTELLVADDPLARNTGIENTQQNRRKAASRRGKQSGEAKKDSGLFRKNRLDEMTVGRTEKPTAKPRGRGKTGRPGM
jgi:excinuclease ABC subunit B